MKKIIPIIIAVVVFASCDKINKPYRNIDPLPSLCDMPSFAAITANDVIQKHLLEDYTGHKCINCPKAHEVAKIIKTAMKDTLIMVAIHAQYFAKPDAQTDACSFHADYRSEAGEIYSGSEGFNIGSFPSGMINRIGRKAWSTPNDWKLCFDTLTRNAPTIGLQIIANYDMEQDAACVFVNTTLFSDFSSNLRLCVFLTESNLISPQKDAVLGDICDYEHNHVLRKAINHPWGDNLSLSSTGESLIKAYSCPFGGTSWKKENCHLIAFVYDDNTKEIIQVEEIKLIP